MFTLFKKMTTKEAGDEIVFQLSESTNITLDLVDPPYYSRFYLINDGKKVANVSVPPDISETIQHYANTVMKTADFTNNLFLSKLKELNLTTFVEKVEKYVEPTDHDNGSSLAMK